MQNQQTQAKIRAQHSHSSHSHSASQGAASDFSGDAKFSASLSHGRTAASASRVIGRSPERSVAHTAPPLINGLPESRASALDRRSVGSAHVGSGMGVRNDRRIDPATYQHKQTRQHQSLMASAQGAQSLREAEAQAQARRLAADRQAPPKIDEARLAQERKRLAKEAELHERAEGKKRRLHQSPFHDYQRALAPDYVRPFNGLADAWQRLLPYHVVLTDDETSLSHEEWDGQVDKLATRYKDCLHSIKDNWNRLYDRQYDRAVKEEDLEGVSALTVHDAIAMENVLLLDHYETLRKESAIANQKAMEAEARRVSENARLTKEMEERRSHVAQVAASAGLQAEQAARMAQRGVAMHPNAHLSGVPPQTNTPLQSSQAQQLSLRGIGQLRHEQGVNRTENEDLAKGNVQDRRVAAMAASYPNSRPLGSSSGQLYSHTPGAYQNHLVQRPSANALGSIPRSNHERQNQLPALGHPPPSHDQAKIQLKGHPLYSSTRPQQQQQQPKLQTLPTQNEHSTGMALGANPLAGHRQHAGIKANGSGSAHNPLGSSLGKASGLGMQVGMNKGLWAEHGGHGETAAANARLPSSSSLSKQVEMGGSGLQSWAGSAKEGANRISQYGSQDGGAQNGLQLGKKVEGGLNGRLKDMPSLPSLKTMTKLGGHGGLSAGAGGSRIDGSFAEEPIGLFPTTDDAPTLPKLASTGSSGGLKGADKVGNSESRGMGMGSLLNADGG